MRIVRQTAGGLQEANRIFYQRADWTEGKYAKRIVKNGQVIWQSSPYDAATTAYLRATYPLHWQAIKQFGLDNPSLCPFINEDNDLIVSLVGVGKERWLVGDGVAFLYIPIQASSFDRFKFDLKNRETASSYQPFFDTNPYGLACWTSVNSCVTTLTGTESSQSSCSQGRHTFEKIGGKWYLDGNEKQSKSLAQVTYNGYWLYRFANSTTRVNKMPLLRFEHGDVGAEKCIGVPCYHNGAAGMLDIVNAQWYGNANTSGAFTIEITDTPT